VVVRAAVFDFYGTLSVSASRAERRAGVQRIADALELPADDLYDALGASFTDRATGARGDLEQTMQWVAERCGCTPTAGQLRRACVIRRANEEVFARNLRADAETTLRALHQRGIKLGVLSDCTHELPEIWPSLPIAPYVDVTVFSVRAGMRKPHPDLYATVMRSLEVTPAQCVYVGDGGSGELTGAAQAGMTPFHLVTADAEDALIYDADATWTGPNITALGDVVPLLVK
jgi:putative hydrolase of the HAD superfamily